MTSKRRRRRSRTREDIINRQILSDFEIEWQKCLSVSQFKKNIKFKYPQLEQRIILKFLKTKTSSRKLRRKQSTRRRNNPLIYTTACNQLWAIDSIYLPMFTSVNSSSSNRRRRSSRPPMNSSDFAIMLIDYHSKFVTGIYCKRINATNACKCLAQKLESVAGSGRRLAGTILWADRGVEFVNRSFQTLCRENGIRMRHSGATSSIKAASIERFFRTLRQLINHLKASAPELKYPQLLSRALSIYNHTNVHSTTGMTPADGEKYENTGRLEHIYFLKRMEKMAREVGDNSSSRRRRVLKIGERVHLTRPRSVFFKTGQKTLNDGVQYIVIDRIHGDLGYMYRIRAETSDVPERGSFSANYLIPVVVV